MKSKLFVFLSLLVIASMALAACGSPEPTPEIVVHPTPAEPEWSYKLFVNHEGEGDNWTTSITIWAKSADQALPTFIWDDGYEYTPEGWNLEGKPFKGHHVAEAKILINGEEVYLLPMQEESTAGVNAYIP